MKLILVLSLSLITGLTIVSCGKKTAAVSTPDSSSGSSGNSGGSSKAIASLWSTGGFSLDLTSATTDGVPFTAVNTDPGGQACILTMTLGAPSGGHGACEVTAASYDIGSSGADGSGSFACAQNPFNTCGSDVGVAGGYYWDGTTLSFPNNGINYK